MHLITFPSLMIAASVGLIVSGCAATNLENSDATAALVTPAVTEHGAYKSYALTPKEKDLSCKQLSGRMQLRILEIRDYNERMQASGLSRAVEAIVSSTVGHGEQAAVSDSKYAEDIAVLEAYNRELAEKGCKSYDLAEELKPKDASVTPLPSIEARKP